MASATKREKDPKKRLIITGLGLVSIFGCEIDTFCNKLLEGECGIHLIDMLMLRNTPSGLQVGFVISLLKATLIGRMIAGLMIPGSTV